MTRSELFGKKKFACGVAGLAETFPSFSVSGPFLPDAPGFQVPPDSIFPLQLRSSSRALPIHLHFCNCSDVLCFIYSLLTCPNHSTLLRLIAVAIGTTFASSKISPFHRCSNRLTNSVHRSILISVAATRYNLLLTLTMFRSRSNHCLL